MPVPHSWVIVVAWPNQEVLESLVPGDTVPVTVVAKAKTNADGGFNLRLQSVGLLARMKHRDGLVNLEYRTVGTREVFSRNSPRRVVELGGRAVLARGGESPSELVALEQDGADAATVVEDLRPAAFPAETPDGIETDPQARVMKNDPSFTECGYPTVVKDYGAVWNLVGQLYSTATSGFSAQYTFSGGGSSQVGTAFSLSGNYGTFSVNGTSGTSYTADVGYPSLQTSGGRYYDTKFVSRLYKWHCAAYRPNGDGSGVLYWTIWDEYHVKVLKWVGFSQVRSVPTLTTKAANCGPYAGGPNAYFRLTTSASQTWSNGYTIGSLIGINGSTLTGYSTGSKIEIKLNVNRTLCGSASPPGPGAKQIQVQP